MAPSPLPSCIRPSGPGTQTNPPDEPRKTGSAQNCADSPGLRAGHPRAQVTACVMAPPQEQGPPDRAAPATPLVPMAWALAAECPPPTPRGSEQGPQQDSPGSPGPCGRGSHRPFASHPGARRSSVLVVSSKRHKTCCCARAGPRAPGKAPLRRPRPPWCSDPGPKRVERSSSLACEAPTSTSREGVHLPRLRPFFSRSGHVRVLVTAAEDGKLE